MPADATLPVSHVMLRTIAMPADTNPAGDIFGGWLMAQMDLAASNAAARRARGRCATVAVDGIAFIHPVRGGGGVAIYAELVKGGRSSMSFKVEAFARPRQSETDMKVTQGLFTFVALDDEARPRPVPQE